MKYLKTMADLLSQNKDESEVYVSDQKKRSWRSYKGYYTKKEGVFSFIHLIKKWDKIVGELMAANTIPLKIKNRTLFISTKHSIFAQELGFLAPKIIEKIEGEFPSFKGQIKNIKFSHSNNFGQTHDEKKVPQNKKRKLHPHSPEYKLLRQKADSFSDEFEDPEVRDAIKKFLLS